MSSEYLLGDHEEELRRLIDQHRVWSDVTHQCWRHAGFGRGEQLLDLGCGPGLCTVELAQWVGPDGGVTALDPSRVFIEALERRAKAEGLQNVQTRCCALQDLQAQGGGYDGAWMRWLLCFLEHPDQALKRVADALRPGGHLAVLDYYNYRAFTLAPRSEAMDEIVAAIETSWNRSGGSLNVGERLPAYMEAAGLEVTAIRPVARVARPGSAHWYWPENFLRHFLPHLRDEGLIDEATQESFWQDWAKAGERPGAFLALPPMLAIHARKLE